MVRRFFFAAVLFFSCVLASCNHDENTLLPARTGRVGVLVAGIDGTTKADSGDELIDSFVIAEVDSLGLVVDTYISDFDDLPFALESLTKGGIITDDGSSGTTNINATATEFGLEGWLGSENRYPNSESDGKVNFEDDETNYHFLRGKATKGSSGWELDGVWNWRNSVPTTLWSCYPFASSSRVIYWPKDDSASDGASYGKPTDDEQKTFVFTYTSPSNVANHEDLLFAYNYHKVSYKDDGTLQSGSDPEDVTIRFHHALAAIRFDVSGALDNDIIISNITFKDVLSKGNCEVTGSGASPGSVSFNWTPTASSETDFSEDFVAEDFTEKSLDGTTDNSLMSLGSKKFFFFIPQTVSGKISMTITFSTDGGATAKDATYTFSGSSTDPQYKWVAGKIYTYKISLDKNSVSVSVTDSVTASLKSDVSVKNDGSKSAFVRASIVAYWADASGNYVAPCDYTNQGTLTGLAAGNWSENTTDGFFYYNGEVEPGDDIGSSLLTSYAPGEAPISGAVLRMVITAQAIEYDSTKTCYDAFNN